ncbi:MAG: hypothetical protein U1F76_29480 [Candidatus Competibacteraceae bacterium]
MPAHRSRRLVLANTQGVASDTAPVAPQPNRDDFSAKVLKRAPLTLAEVADFLGLESVPDSQQWAARALDYATTLGNPLDRMAGFTLARAWLATTPPDLLHRPGGRLRLHAVAGG